MAKKENELQETSKQETPEQEQMSAELKNVKKNVEASPKPKEKPKERLGATEKRRIAADIQMASFEEMERWLRDDEETIKSAQVELVNQELDASRREEVEGDLEEAMYERDMIKAEMEIIKKMNAELDKQEASGALKEKNEKFGKGEISRKEWEKSEVERFEAARAKVEKPEESKPKGFWAKIFGRK